MMRAICQWVIRLGRHQCGTAAIEFGLVAPVFFSLLLGIVDVGRYMWTLNTVQYAIDQGVRTGVVQGLSEDEVKDKVEDSLMGIAANVTVTPTSSTLSISAVSNYAFLFPISTIMASTTINLRTEMPK